MKRKMFCTTTVTVCIMAVAYGGFHLLHRRNATDLLLKENVEALSDDGGEKKKYRAYKCYYEEAQEGTSGLICLPETNPPVYLECPNETKKVNAFSTTSSCIKEES